jgi:hypothetical protein
VVPCLVSSLVGPITSTWSSCSLVASYHRRSWGRSSMVDSWRHAPSFMYEGEPIGCGDQHSVGARERERGNQKETKVIFFCFNIVSIASPLG